MYANFKGNKNREALFGSNLRLLLDWGGFFHKTAFTLVGRKIKMDKRILYALVWLSMRNTSIHVPQAKEHAFFYKLAECKQPRMTFKDKHPDKLLIR